MLHGCSAIEDHPLSGCHLYHIGLCACPISYCAPMESSDEPASQSWFVRVDGARSDVSPIWPKHRNCNSANSLFSYSTAACCTVRTALNWQNVTSDPTWTSVYNLYWRAAEVNFGIIAACLPPLRPAYATTTSFLKSYLSRVSTKRSSTFTRIVEGKSTKARSDEEPIVQRGTNAAQQITSPLEAASHDASAEVDRARKYGIGEEGFEMKSIPGDRTSMDSGIKKTTRVDVEVSSPRSLALGGGERGDDGTYFV